MSKDNGTLSPEEAKKTLQDDIKKRTDLCRKDIAECLSKYGCRMEVVTIIRDNNHPIHQVSIISNG